VLVTSVALTPKRKAKLVGALSGHIKRPADVVGPAELNMLLRKYPQVERAHFKLWLSSTRVLQQVLHSDIHTSTNYALKDIERRVALYVHTPAFAEAVSILNEHHACVIAGIPGIGKSMLAEMLLYALVGEGYEPIVLRNELSDADRIYETDRRQVFLYDDFLGQTASVEKLGKNEDAHLAAFIRRVSESPNKRFILTTREYILQQAHRLYEKLNDPAFERIKYLLTLNRYSRFEKARILYNHLYFSDLTRDDQRRVLENDTYLSIIDHRNYSPRLIEHVLSMRSQPESDWDMNAFFIETLENPERLWSHAVHNQLDDVERSILLVMCSQPAEVRLQELTPVTQAYIGPSSESDPVALKRAMSVLEDTFITVGRVQSGPTVRFHNPSIRDFLLGYIDSEPAILARLVSAARSFEQIELLRRYGREGIGWRADETRSFDGMSSWFSANGAHVVERLISLFLSPFGDYTTHVFAPRRRDLQPSGSLERRLAQVIAASSEYGVDIGSWIGEALTHMQSEWQMSRGNREDWLAVLDAADRDSYREQIMDASRESQDWFFSELGTSDEFGIYTQIVIRHPWWLSLNHAESVKELFGWFAESELDWILYQADVGDQPYQHLDALLYLADELSIALDPITVAAAEEVVQQMPDPDDASDESGFGWASGTESEGDIAGLFESL
jgi:hypothetical protein